MICNSLDEVRANIDRIDHNIPLITNARLATAFIEAFCAVGLQGLQVKSWQEYV